MKYFASTFGAGLGIAAVMMAKVIYDAAQGDRLIVGLIFMAIFFAMNTGENGIGAYLIMRAGGMPSRLAGRTADAPDTVDLQSRQAQLEWTIERARREARRDQPRALPAWAHGADDDDDGVVL